MTDEVELQKKGEVLQSDIGKWNQRRVIKIASQSNVTVINMKGLGRNVLKFLMKRLHKDQYIYVCTCSSIMVQTFTLLYNRAKCQLSHYITKWDF